MKPTWSLVPYTEIMPIEPTLDHYGPITNNVLDNAILLRYCYYIYIIYLFIFFNNK